MTDIEKFLYGVKDLAIKHNISTLIVAASVPDSDEPGTELQGSILNGKSSDLVDLWFAACHAPNFSQLFQEIIKSASAELKKKLKEVKKNES